MRLDLLKDFPKYGSMIDHVSGTFGDENRDEVCAWIEEKTALVHDLDIARYLPFILEEGFQKIVTLPKTTRIAVPYKFTHLLFLMIERASPADLFHSACLCIRNSGTDELLFHFLKLADDDLENVPLYLDHHSRLCKSFAKYRLETGV